MARFLLSGRDPQGKEAFASVNDPGAAERLFISWIKSGFTDVVFKDYQLAATDRVISSDAVKQSLPTGPTS